MSKQNSLPKTKQKREDILKELYAARDKDAKWKEGKTFSLVFYAGEEILSLIKEAYTAYFSENGLNPSAFPSLKKFESEVVRMTLTLLNGNKDTSGSMTSGGTESILMAVKTAKSYAMAKNPKIEKPEMVVSASAHPAFDKAAYYFGIKIIKVPVRGDYRADVEAMENAITQNTILMVGSAPQYPQGVVDPIAELGKVAQKRNILLHVDACVGGFMLPFVRKLGYPVPDFDFKVPGVTSMSVDLHKYAYAAKGASVVLYRNRELRRHQFFVTTDWAGGIYASPAMLGTRPGGSIAAAWAIINHLGEEGYLELNKQVMDTVQYMRQGIEAIPELKILGDPHMSVMAMASDELDIYSIGDEMSIRGWHMDRQQDPASLHLTISFGHTISKDEFIKDLQASVAQVKKLSLRKVMTKTQLGVVRGLFKALPNPVVSALTKVSSKFGSAGVPKRSAAMYGMMGALPEQGDLKELVIDTLDKMFKV